MLERLNFKICVFDLKGCWGKDAPEPMNFKIFMLLTYRGDGRGEAGGGRWAKTLQNLSYSCPCEAQYRAAKAVCGRHGLYSYLGRNLYKTFLY